MKIINDRYEVVTLLNRESCYIEYLVSDKYKNDLLKRIRIFDTEMSNYDFVRQMEDLFVEIKTLVHENLLAAYEFQTIVSVNGNRVNRKQYFYTYEHYDESLKVTYIDLNKAEINQVIVQLCKIVRFLHFRGVVYKYLSFDQVLILRTDGILTLKLKDVAGNFINDYYFKTDHEKFSQFIAPEIIWGEDVDERADIYSLGALIYYLYYRLDYKLKSLESLVESGIGNDINRFIMKSTNHIKDERYQDVKTLISDLATLIWIEIDNNDVGYYNRIHNKTRIIGRDTLLNEIKTKIVLKSRKQNVLNAFIIKGDNGSGKSRIMKEIAYMAKFGRYNMFRIKVSDSSDVFQTTRALVETLSHQDDLSPMLMQKYGAELACLVPSLYAKWNIKEQKEIDLELEYLRVLNRVFNFFVDYTSNKFFILLIDDFEKISTIEKMFYKMVLTHRGSSQYLLIASCNTCDKNLEKMTDLVSINKLPSLNLEETGRMIKAMLGLNYVPYKLTHRLMLENQGKVSLTRRMIIKLWHDGTIFFDEKTMNWNLDKVDDRYSFDYVEKRREDYEWLISSLSDEHYEILRRLSILKGSFNLQTIFQIANIEEEQGYIFLSEMEEKIILNKRISDVEYVFAFDSNELRKAFYDTLTEEERIMLSSQAANLYERKYLDLGEIDESLIDHLLVCNDIEKAAAYCVIFADRYIEKNNQHKALEFMEKGLEIYFRLEKVDVIIDLGLKLIRHLVKSGKLERALEHVQFLSDYLQGGHKIALIDVQIEHAYIMYLKNDIIRAEDLSDDAIASSKEISYLNGELKAAYVKCKCLISAGDLIEHNGVADHYLSISDQMGMTFHQAVFNNEKGINYLYSNALDSSIEAFTESLKYYQALNDEENIVKLYNNFGVIYLDGYGDFMLARDYFRKAYTKASKNNYSVTLPIYLNNLGETYRIEGRYEMANKYFEESFQHAENVGDKNMTILSFLNLCHGHLLGEKYGKAYKMITRLEHEVQVIKKRGYDKFDFYLLHFEFYLSMNSIMKVNQWRYDFNADEVVDEYRKYRLKMIDLKLAYKRNRIGHTNRSLEIEYPIDAVKGMLRTTSNPAEAKLLREFVQDMIIEAIVEADYLNAETLLKMDDQLVTSYNTKLVRLKRSFIDACFSDFVVERIEVLLDQIKEQSAEFLWRAYYILGNEYYENSNMYGALKSYLMALDVISDLSNNIPNDYRETYILHDDMKMALKSRLNGIIRVFTSHEGVKQGLTLEDRIDTLEDFFDLDQFNALYNSNAFLGLVYKMYQEQGHTYYDSATELIKHLEKDEISNLKHILAYIQQITAGERAFIYLLDENDNVSEILSTDTKETPYDIMKLIGSFGNDIEGIFISKLNVATSIQLLTPEQKGLICFPIYETTSSSINHGENRRDDIFASKKSIVGYVYIDTKSVINRFNATTFEQAKSFINLFYVFIDNYNLKKLSTIDKLTGVYLRKHIEQQFAVQMSISRQHNYNLSVIMMDIDKFKSVNDNYGHRKGDEILSTLGSLLLRSVRSTDFVARYGGEEFIILLPETDSISGYKVAEKIRKLVDSSKLLGEDMDLTISLGIATYPDDGANEEELIEKADQALYYSKNNGRNRSTSWDDNLIKEGHRYDRLTGILTGNISSDTRNMQAVLDIINQLNHSISREEGIRNMFVSLLDITEGEEIQFLKFDSKGILLETLYKKKGQEGLSDVRVVDDRIVTQFMATNVGQYFIDWYEMTTLEHSIEETTGPMHDWKSYIVLGFNSGVECGILSISVSIKTKEFDFSNFNFVESLRPVLEHVLF